VPGPAQNIAPSSFSISQQEYDALVRKNAQLSHELAQLKRLIFGSKSERFVPTVVPGQLHLDLEGIEPGGTAPPRASRPKSASRKHGKNGSKPVRTALPAHLPRVEEVIEPDALPHGAKKIGEEITELLEYSPAKVFVRRLVRPKYALPKDQGIQVAELPTLPIPRSNAGPGLLAHILVSKFVDHLPYYRQQQIFKRQKLSIPSSTFNSWFNQSCDLLLPLYNCLKQQVQQADYLMADETPIPVQGSHKKRATHTGYHWVYYAPNTQMVCFDYQMGRSREGPDAFLKDFTGALQADGYAGYEHYESNMAITLLGCMAHARRYFEKALDNDRQRAEQALTKIGWLYRRERRIRQWNLAPPRAAMMREKRSRPKMQELHQWLREQQQYLLPQSPIAKAVGYALNHWKRLERYLNDPIWHIDNNLVENAIRPIALGRKNYMFAGSHEAAQRAAMMYSFFGTCKINEVEPFAWLRDTLAIIPEHPANRLKELLPIGKV